MKALWYVLVFVIGGIIGFVAGGIGGGTVGMMAGTIGGTEFGVCTALKVAEDKGILTAEQTQRLLDDTAAHLRTEFKDLVEKAEISEKIPLNAETCEKLITEAKARPKKD
jgi:uncharacterized membrane protein (UPF0136 family)